MKQIKEKHPLAIRWFHWVSFPLLVLMIWSGLMIYWAHDVYRIGWGNITILQFFPTSFYQALHLPFRLAEGMSLHFMFMWLFMLNGLLYVLYTFDLKLTKTPPPVRKFNGAQQIAYSAVILMGVGSLLTGIAIYKPIQFSWLCTLLGGYTFARMLHFALTIGYVLFFLIHIVQVIRAGWNNFQAMITGFEVHKEPIEKATNTANL
jgi:thiosulfate reductase cytochrome b subunit